MELVLTEGGGQGQEKASPISIPSGGSCQPVWTAQEMLGPGVGPDASDMRLAETLKFLLKAGDKFQLFMFSAKNSPIQTGIRDGFCRFLIHTVNSILTRSFRGKLRLGWGKSCTLISHGCCN